MNQKDVLDALVGNPEYYRICGAVFVCGTPLASDAGSETLVKGSGMAEARKLLAESGYDGTPVVVTAPGAVVTLKAQPIVAAQLLRDAGFKVDVQATDWQTVVTRRASQKPPKEGGWNMFFTNWVGADVVNPVVNLSINGKGKNGGWFGWPDDPRSTSRGGEDGRKDWSKAASALGSPRKERGFSPRGYVREAMKRDLIPGRRVSAVPRDVSRAAAAAGRRASP